jgi:hypothetical protein
MKRGWITWDKTELPPAAFEKRLAVVREHLATRELAALVVYSDVWRSNQGRYFSNFMPYWNRALLVIPQDGAPVLLCGLSPRVYPWIKSVTILEEIRPSANIAQQLLLMCGEKGWKKVGVLDFPQLPYDLYEPVNHSDLEIANVFWSAVHPAPDEFEMLMYRRAAKLAREVLEEEVPQAVGLIDHEFVGRLELKFRRAGAEDLVILVTNGDTPPLSPTGATLSRTFSTAVALEYRGHWVRIARSAGETQGTPSESKIELLSGPYPYEFRDRADLDDGSLFSLQNEYKERGRRLFRGDSWRQAPGGAELL